MATIPEGYVELDLVGFTDKGDYNSGVTYVKNDLVHNNNKIYLSLQDDNTGNALPSSTETENTYWKVWLAGSADDLANITVKDTSNVTGSGLNSIVVAQTLIDAIASKVMNDLVAKSQIVNNLTTSTTGSVLDASRGKNLQDQITQLNSNKLQCYSIEQMTAKMSLSETQAILDIIRVNDNTRIQLIFNFSGKKLAVSYFDGSTWSQKDLATWT